MKTCGEVLTETEGSTTRTYECDQPEDHSGHTPRHSAIREEPTFRVRVYWDTPATRKGRHQKKSLTRH